MAFIELNGINVHYNLVNEQAQDTLVLLHGFTGSTSTWDEVLAEFPKALKVVTVDLIGHGLTDAPANLVPYSMQAQIKLLDNLFDELQLQHITLLGYSMGGRVALSYASAYPARLKKLILESASPGLDDETARASRKLADEKLADKIEQQGIEAFVLHWENIPLFKTQKTLEVSKQEAIRAERLNQKELGLANSLRGMGTGVMPSLWHQLESLSMPITLLTGELDTKFVDIAKNMKKLNENINHFTIPHCGHAIHVENPQKFATIVKESISI